MSVFSREDQRIFVRVVYDGPALAGKTTNLKQLCRFFTTRRRSELFMPEEHGGRTLFFDWLQLEGGVVGGFGLRCQLLTVPGQRILSWRRRRLVDSADVLVYVCESTAEGVKTAREAIAKLPEVPLVVQANKQDLPGALSPAEISAALELPPGVPCVPACAEQGLGVRETAVLAIRAAANLVQRDLLERGIDALSGTLQTSEDLYQAMRIAEEVRPEMGAGTPFVEEDSSQESPSLEAPFVTEKDEEETVIEMEPLFPAADAPTGFIWPAALGREVLRQVAGETARRRDDLAGQPGREDGSGKSDALIYQAGEWCLKTSRRRCFRDADDGRTALLGLARRKIVLGAMLPPSTVVSLSSEHPSSVWLWTITPWFSTLRALMTRATEEEDVSSLAGALWTYAIAAVNSLLLAARSGVVLDVHPSNFTVVEGLVYYLDDDIHSGERIPSIGYSLLHRVEEYSKWPGALDAYLTALEENIVTRVTRVDAARLDLEKAFAETIGRSDAVEAARERLLASVARCA
jgi:signal recognition particle receptor subunit beta